MKTIPLGELITQAGPRAKSSDSLPVYAVTKHRGFVPSLEYFNKQVFSRVTKGYKIAEPGDFAYATIHLDEGSIGIAPERCLISPMYTVFRPHEQHVDADYLIRFLKSPSALSAYDTLGRGAVHRRKSISLDALSGLKVPLPQIAEQRRIAAILDQTDALRAKQRQALDHVDALTQSIFHDMFGGRSATAQLKEIAQVTSGITKGRSTADPTVETPYLAVSNVQAGRLSLETVKTIAATTAEIARYALRAGDLVLTEGGDPDKLGRGTVWSGELPLCIHQNHVFRVRLNKDAISPRALSAYMQTAGPRRHFMRSAKQTTGIASINKTQLENLPVIELNSAECAQFEQRVSKLNGQRAVVERGIKVLDELFASLQSRAFRAEL